MMSASGLRKETSIQLHVANKLIMTWEIHAKLVSINNRSGLVQAPDLLEYIFRRDELRYKLKLNKILSEYIFLILFLILKFEKVELFILFYVKI